MTKFSRCNSKAAVSVLLAASVVTLTVALPNDLTTSPVFAQSTTPSAKSKSANDSSRKPEPSKGQAAKKDEPWPINDNVDDPAEWGKAFPLHYELYKKTVDMQRTKYGGSEAVPRTPTQADPRAMVSRTKVDEDIGLRRCGRVTRSRPTFAKSAAMRTCWRTKSSPSANRSCSSRALA